MSTAVLDTNVLASGFASRTGTPGWLLLLWTYEVFELVVSEPILAELARTFEKPYFRRQLTPPQRAADMALLRDEGTLTPITVEVSGVATHAEDDLILATAVSAEVDYLVTGDRRLQSLESYRGVTILSPRAFLDVLASQVQP